MYAHLFSMRETLLLAIQYTQNGYNNLVKHYLTDYVGRISFDNRRF